MAIGIRQSDNVRKRIERLFLFVTVFYVGLIGRLVYLQAIHGAYYKNKAARLRSQNITLEARRGAIIDRDGKWLAVTTHSGILVCDPTQVKVPERTAAILASILRTDSSQILPLVSPGRTVKGGKPDRMVIVRKDMTPEQVEALRDARGQAALAKDLNGLSVNDEPGRAYPTGRDAVHLVGFLVNDDKGQPRGAMGLEQSMDSTLRGRAGFVRAEVDPRRRVIPDSQKVRIDPADGPDVRLTIDSTIQHIVQSELSATCRQYHPEGACAIVIDPKTGDILSLVNYPDFDPVKRGELKHSQKPLTNRGLSLYEPGSTMKIITAAAALQDHVITPNTTFECSGHLAIGNRTISCAAHGGETPAHGTVTIRQIIQHSCNVGTAQVGMKLGIERMAKYLEAFGLLDKTGIGLPADMHGRLGFGAEAGKGGLGKVARVAFGQSVMVTPLGLANAYAAIANHGMLMKPRLIAAYQNADGKVIRQVPPQRVRQVITPEIADELRSYLETVVTSGTGKSAAVPGYTVAGKTGTAQKVVAGQHGYARGKYVASFFGFLPSKDPKAVICVVVDEPQGAYYGAQVAAPVFQAVARQLMWYWKVPPDDPASLQNSKLAKRE